MPYVVTTLAGRSAGGRAPPSTIVAPAVGVDALQGGGDERDDTPALGGIARRRCTAAASKPSADGEPGPADERSRHHRQPADVDSGRHAIQ
jgi:hypothetical protein